MNKSDKVFKNIKRIIYKIQIYKKLLCILPTNEFHLRRILAFKLSAEHAHNVRQ